MISKLTDVLIMEKISIKIELNKTCVYFKIVSLNT